MKINLIKKITLIGLVAPLLSFTFFFQEKEVSAQEISLLSKDGEAYSKVINRSEPFNTLMLTFEDEVEGLMMNTNPLHSDHWQEVEVHDDGFGVEALVFFHPTKVIQFKQNEAQQKELKFNAEFLNFEGQSSFGNRFSGPMVGLGKSKVIKRHQWGADESLKYWTPEMKKSYENKKVGSDACATYKDKYPSEVKVARRSTFDGNGEFIWPLSYAKSVKKIAVHHTDSELRDITGDSRMDSRDYEAMVRAIYYYHTVRRGWGDIGYHYLIDPLGNIYEGRYGGDKVIGAHALCHNNGTLGIAMIGNYEDHYLSRPAQEALIRLIAEKSKQFNIDPKGVSSFRGKRLANIFAHKDVRPTSCPGEKLYSQLPRIREKASLISRSSSFNENDLSATTLDYDARFTSGDLEFKLLPNQTKTVELAFKNTGKKAWNQNTWLHVALNNRSGAEVAPVVEDKRFVAADLKESRVLPGGTGHFEIDLRAGFYGGYYQFELSPVVNGQYKVSRSSVFASIDIEDPQLDYQVVSESLPRGTFFQGQRVQASIKLKNTGNVKWVNYGKTPIRLGTEQGRDRKSILTNSSRLGHLLESEVSPNQTGTFVFDLTMPDRFEGEVSERFAPVIEHVSWLKDKQLGFNISIKEPRHMARVVSKTKLISMKPGEQRKITIDLENKGDLPWSPENMRINTIARGIQLFKSVLRPTKSIDNGKIGEFNFWIQAPYESGKHRVSLISRFGKKSIKGGTIRYLINVPEPRLSARKVDQSKASIEIQPNQEVELEVKYKNNSNAIWQQRGENAVYLAPTQPDDRKSRLFYKDKWPSRFRAARMVESEVKPGEIATFKVKIKPQRKGFYKEYFRLVVEKVGWINNSTARWKIRVAGDRAKEVPNDDQISSNRQKAIDAINRQGSRKVNKKDSSEAGATLSSALSSSSESESKLSSKKNKDFRVRLSHDSNEADITFNQDFSVYDGQKKWKDFEKGEVIKVSKINNRFHVKNAEKSVFMEVPRFIPTSRGIFTLLNMERRPSWNLSLNDNEFRGILEMRVIDGKVNYINELPLEDYMRGLAEVSNGTPTEKQKAIAILARTYAQFYMSDENRKFPGKPYDGSDDPSIFQRYLGYGVEKRSPQFTKSVEDTVGIVVTYRGQLVKTPYFSQSDGRTRSARSVWGWAHTPYLVSVNDPYCKGLTLKGHGVGLSGCGSEGMAKDGKTYEEIIKYYYKGVKIESTTN